MSYQRVDEEDGDSVAGGELSIDASATLKGALGQSPPRSGLTPWQIHSLISIAAGTVMALFGYEQGVFGGILIGQEFQEYFHEPSPSVTGFVTSIYDLGCFGGALLTLLVGEQLGRKRMLIIFTVIMASGIVMQTAANSMQYLVWGRLIAGIGNGGNTATAPVWHVETSHQDMKGKAVVKEMSVNVLGFVISNLITLACSRLVTDASWRFPLGIQLLFVVIILGLVPLLPESPRWLLARGRDADAKRVLASLNDHDIEEEFQTIRTSVRQEMAVQASWAEIFGGGTSTRRVLLGMLLQICQQLTGINMICYFLPLILKTSVGLPELPSRLLSTGIAISYMLATISSIFFIERLGRRPLLMCTAAVMSLTLIGLAISTEIAPPSSSPSSSPLLLFTSGVLATVFITIYLLAFGFAWCSIPWLYPAEINSLSMRTKGAALATACDWFFNWVVVQTTPLGIRYLKWGLYLLYAVFNAAFVPLIFYYVVETGGLSLEGVEKWFAERERDGGGWVVRYGESGGSGVRQGWFSRKSGMSSEEDGVRRRRRRGRGRRETIEAERRLGLGDEEDEEEEEEEGAGVGVGIGARPEEEEGAMSGS